MDTPGIHEVVSDKGNKNPTINERINAEAFASLREADVIVRLVDPTREAGKEDERIDEVLSWVKKPVIRTETKQDLPKTHPGTNIDVRVNSTTGEGFTELIDAIVEHLPEGPYLYDPDYYTDQSLDFRISEAIREALFAELGEEIPYASYIEITHRENAEDMLEAHAYIYSETESQKKIIIGKGGQKIARIGQASRSILESIFEKKIFLGLRVKVDKNWRKNTKTLEKLFPKR